MKFFVAKGLKISFGKEDSYQRNDVKIRKVSFLASLIPAEPDDGRLPADMYSKFASNFIGQKLELELGLHSESSPKDNVVRITGDPCLERFYGTAQRERVDVQAVLTFKNFGFTLNKDITKYRAERAFTENSRISQIRGLRTFGIEWRGLYFSNWGGLSSWWYNTYSFDGELDVVLTLTSSIALPPPSLTTLQLKESTDINHKILKEGIGADLSIIPSTGRAVKCHRTFLLAHSATFNSMLKGSYGDAKSNFFKMPELTEGGVEALLEYMYLDDTSKAEDSCIVALELLKAAQKYDMTSLTDKMTKLLTTKPESWYKVDMLMKFYSLVRNAKVEQGLKMKAIKLIKLNIKTLKQSESYRQFFKDDPDGAMELCEYLSV